MERDADGDGAKMSEPVTSCGPPSLPAPPDIVGTPGPQQDLGVLAVMKPGAAKPEQRYLAHLQCSACSQVSAGDGGYPVLLKLEPFQAH